MPDVKHSTQYDKLPELGARVTSELKKSIKCKSRADALRLIADSIEKYGKYNGEQDKKTFGAVDGAYACCLVINPVAFSWTQQRIQNATDIYLERFVQKDTGMATPVSKWSDMHSAEQVIAMLRSEADKLEGLKL